MFGADFFWISQKTDEDRAARTLREIPEDTWVRSTEEDTAPLATFNPVRQAPRRDVDQDDDDTDSTKTNSKKSGNVDALDGSAKKIAGGDQQQQDEVKAAFDIFENLSGDAKVKARVGALVEDEALLQRNPTLLVMREQERDVRYRFRLNLAGTPRPHTPLANVFSRLTISHRRVCSFAGCIFAIVFVVRVRRPLLSTKMQKRVLQQRQEEEVSRRAAKERVLSRKFYGASSRSMALHLKKQREAMKSVLVDAIQQSVRRLKITKFDRNAGCSHGEDDEDEQEEEEEDDHCYSHSHAGRSGGGGHGSKWKDPLRNSELFVQRVRPKEDTLFDRSQYTDETKPKMRQDALPLYLRRDLPSFAATVAKNKMVVNNNNNTGNSNVLGATHEESSVHQVRHQRSEMSVVDQSPSAQMREFGEVLFANAKQHPGLSFADVFSPRELSNSNNSDEKNQTRRQSDSANNNSNNNQSDRVMNNNGEPAVKVGFAASFSGKQASLNRYQQQSGVRFGFGASFSGKEPRHVKVGFTNSTVGREQSLREQSEAQAREERGSKTRVAFAQTIIGKEQSSSWRGPQQQQKLKVGFASSVNEHEQQQQQQTANPLIALGQMKRRESNNRVSFQEHPEQRQQRQQQQQLDRVRRVTSTVTDDHFQQRQMQQYDDEDDDDDDNDDDRNRDESSGDEGSFFRERSEDADDDGATTSTSVVDHAVSSVQKTKSSLTAKAAAGKLPVTKNLFLWDWCWNDEPFIPPHPSLPSFSAQVAASGNKNKSSFTLAERDATKYVTQVRDSELTVFTGPKDVPDLVSDLVLLRNCFSMHEDTSSSASPFSTAPHHSYSSDALHPALRRKGSVSSSSSSPSMKPGDQQHQAQRQQRRVSSSNKPWQRGGRQSIAKEELVAAQTSASFEPFSLHFGMEHSQFVRRSMVEISRQIKVHRQVYNEKRERLMGETVNLKNVFRNLDAQFQQELATANTNNDDGKKNQQQQQQQQQHQNRQQQQQPSPPSGEDHTKTSAFVRRHHQHIQAVDVAVRKKLTEQCDIDIRQHSIDWFERLRNKVNGMMHGGMNRYMQQVFDAFEPVFETGILTSQAFEKTVVLKLYGKQLLERSSLGNLRKKPSISNDNNNNNTTKVFTSRRSNASGGAGLDMSGGSIGSQAPSVISSAQPQHQQQQQQQQQPPHFPSSSGMPPPAHHRRVPSSSNNNNNTAPVVELLNLAEVGSNYGSGPPGSDPGLSTTTAPLAHSLLTPSSARKQATIALDGSDNNNNNNNNNNIANSNSNDQDNFTLPFLDSLSVPTNEECVLVDLGAQFALMRLRVPFNVSQEKTKELILRSGATYALMSAEEVDVVFRNQSQLEMGRARVQRLGKLDEIIQRNERIEKCVEEGRKLAERRIRERRQLKRLLAGKGGSIAGWFSSGGDRSSHSSASISGAGGGGAGGGATSIAAMSTSQHSTSSGSKGSVSVAVSPLLPLKSKSLSLAPHMLSAPPPAFTGRLPPIRRTTAAPAVVFGPAPVTSRAVAKKH